MTRLLKWTGDTFTGQLVPGAGGRGDRPVKHILGVNPTAALLNFGARADVIRPATQYVDSFDHWIQFSDFYLAGGNTYKRNRLEFRFTDDSVDEPIEAATEMYSMRVYFKMNANAIATHGFAKIFSFLNGSGDTSDSNYKWCLTLKEYGLYGSVETQYMPQLRNGRNGTLFDFNYSNQSGIPIEYGPGPTQGQLDNYRCTINRAWRAEVQVDNTRAGNKVFVRIYRANETLMRYRLSLRGTPSASVAADRVYFGDDAVNAPVSGANGIQQETLIGQIEVHDDFDLGGQFANFPAGTSDTNMVPSSDTANGTPHVRQAYEWFEWDGEDLVPLEDLGEWDGEDFVASPVSELTERDFVPPPQLVYHWFSGAPEEEDTTLYYVDSGVLDDEDNPAFPCGLIMPDGTPPAGGWPVWVWAHSGFFVGGSFRAIPRQVVNKLNAMGFAVFTVGYRKSALVFSNTGTYPDYPSAGVWPSHVRDYKNAVNWLLGENYPVNGDKVIFSGYSAGGAIGGTAALSVDLAADDDGPDMRAIATPELFVEAPGPDPVPLACLVWGAPTDLQWAADNDPTHPDFGYPNSFLPLDITAMQSSQSGLIVGAGKALLGNKLNEELPDLTHTSLPTTIARQDLEKLPERFMYIRGGSDYLIPEHHPQALEQAFIDKGYDGYTYRVEAGVIHDRLMDMVEWRPIEQWLDTVPGL